MTSAKQLAANRRNARKSTGPRTEAGKAIARLNAVKHGGLAATPVVPRLEKPDEWRGHLEATLESLRPVGHLETMLAGRVALLLWRLGRVARYEHEAIALAQERAEDDLTTQRDRDYRSVGADRPEELREEVREAREQGQLLARFNGLPDEAPVPAAEATAILSAAAARTEQVDPEEFSMPDVVPDEIPWEEYDGWTAGLVRRGIAAMAAAEETTADRLWLSTLGHAYAEKGRLEAEAKRVATELDRMRRERMLPPGPELDKLTRSEAHLSRQLAQALHELQRLQTARSGDFVPPPAVVDVNLSAGE